MAMALCTLYILVQDNNAGVESTIHAAYITHVVPQQKLPSSAC
jgi:hypothetical protein